MGAQASRHLLEAASSSDLQRLRKALSNVDVNTADQVRAPTKLEPSSMPSCCPCSTAPDAADTRAGRLDRVALWRFD
jgi:hypothetical protein